MAAGVSTPSSGSSILAATPPAPANQRAQLQTLRTMRSPIATATAQALDGMQTQVDLILAALRKPTPLPDVFTIKDAQGTDAGSVGAWTDGGTTYSGILITGTGVLRIVDTANRVTFAQVENRSNGTAAQAFWRVLNDTGALGQLGIYSSGHAAYGMLAAGDVHVYGNAAVAIMADVPAGVIKFATGGTTERMRLDSAGKLGVGTTNPTVSGTGKLHASGDTARIVDANNTPANSAAAGNDGEVRMDAGFIYVHTSGSWRRVAVVTF